MATGVAIRLRLVVGTWFQVLFTRLLGVLFTFPSRYLYTIGHGRVFSLARWCWQLPTGFPRSRGTQGHPRGHSPYAYRTFTFSGAAFQTASTSACDPVWGALQPRCGRNHTGLGCSPFARHYLGNRYCFLFLRVLRCFTSPGSPPAPMFSAQDDRPSACRVAPFGDPRITGCLRLPTAYRSLPRPSSPVRAKASTMCP